MSTKDVTKLESLANEIALAEARNESATSETRAWADRLRASYRAQTASRLRELVPLVDPERARPVRPEILAMARDALISRIDDIVRRMGGTVQVAHRKLTELSDHDLRQLLDMLVAQTETSSPSESP